MSDKRESDNDSQDEQISEGSGSDENFGRNDFVRCCRITSPIIAQERMKNMPLKRPITCDDKQTSSSMPKKKSTRAINDSNRKLGTITGKFKNFGDFHKKMIKQNGHHHLSLHYCSISKYLNETLPPMDSLKSITFHSCDENIFKAFSNQLALEKILIKNSNQTWNGFPHWILNTIGEKCKNFNHLVLIGCGTVSYFNGDNFPFQIKTLETTMLDYNWFIGIRDARTSFLKSQKHSLKDLTIHQLPYDFDGGKVIKFIIEEMHLDNFHYGKVSLILEGQRQNIKEIVASDIQITSLYEIVKQFKCEKIKLILSNSDIAYDEIDAIVNSSTEIFNNVEEFEVIDNSNRSIMLFFGLFKNLPKLQKLTFKSKDRNIYKILKELPKMKELSEIILLINPPSTSDVDVSKFAENFKFTKAADNNFEEPRGHFSGNAGRAPQDNAAGGDEGNEYDDLEQADQEQKRGDGQGGDDYDGNNYGGFPNDSILGMLVESSGPSKHQSTLNESVLPEADKKIYYVHVFGFYKIILNSRNIEEFEELLGELCNSIYVPNNEQGKICFKILNDNQDNRNKIHKRIKELAFITDKIEPELPLIVLPTNRKILVSCCVERNLTWDLFLVRLSGENEIIGSFWEHDTTWREGELRYKIKFYVDGKSYAIIKKRRYELKWNGSRIDITTELNGDPYANDIADLGL